MPSSIGHGPISLRIEQRQVDTNKKIEEIERKGPDGTIVRYQRNVAEGLLHRIGRFFTDHAKGKEKARGTLCDRTPDNVPTHIMVMGHKVATRQASGAQGLRAEIEFSPTVSTGNSHNLSRLKEDLGLQLGMRGKKNEMPAMKTFLKYATGEAAIPRQIKGNSQRREMDSVIRQIKQFSETFSELEQENGLHADDAGWVKQQLTQLLDSAKNIRQADAADHDPVKRLNLSASVWQSIEEFKALQTSIKPPLTIAVRAAGTTHVATAGTTVAASGTSPPFSLPPATKGTDVPTTDLPTGPDQNANAAGNIKLTDGLVKALDDALRQHGKALPKNYDPNKDSDWDV